MYTQKGVFFNVSDISRRRQSEYVETYARDVKARRIRNVCRLKRTGSLRTNRHTARRFNRVRRDDAQNGRIRILRNPSEKQRLYSDFNGYRKATARRKMQRFSCRHRRLYGKTYQRKRVPASD